MEPSLFNGDLVVYKPINRKSIYKLNKGSIIIFKCPINRKDLFIKRLYKLTNKGLELRGDNQAESIDSRHFGLINKLNIIGLVEYTIRPPFHKLDKHKLG
tara:strand:- start:898 stop:1197 length:300 start_codon:yes stop_codon:yes gene_type:complete